MGSKDKLFFTLCTGWSKTAKRVYVPKCSKKSEKLSKSMINEIQRCRRFDGKVTISIFVVESFRKGNARSPRTNANPESECGSVVDRRRQRGTPDTRPIHVSDIIALRVAACGGTKLAMGKGSRRRRDAPDAARPPTDRRLHPT